MAWKLSNFAESTLSQAILAADTTIYIDADEVDLLPTLGVGDLAKGVIFDSTNREIVNISAWNTNGTLTVVRARESTTARDWPAGTRFVHTPTAEILQAVLDATVQAVYRGTAAGTNAITVTVSGSVPVPNDGDEISFEIANTNTSSVDISITNGTTTVGPFDLVRQGGGEFEAGELAAGWRVKAVYDSAAGDFILNSQGSKIYDINSINQGPIDAGNLLPNGGLLAWNNGTSFNTSASGTETADGVVIEYDGSIGAFTLTRQSFSLGQTDVDGGPKYYGRWDQSSAGSGSSYRRVRFKIPRVERYAGKDLVASAYLKADSARNVTAALVQSFGTGGSPSAEVVAATEVWALTTSWARFDLIATPASVAGKTLGSNGDDGLIFELSLPVNAVMTIDFAMAQVEFGNYMSQPHRKFPLDWEQGGVGGSYSNLADFFNTNAPDIYAIEQLAGTSGGLFKTAANTWALRTLTEGSPTVLTITNPAGVAGNPTFTAAASLVNYVADPLSVAELASITGTFGTAAFVADSGLVHITGTESISGAKTFTSAVAVTLAAAGAALTLTSTDAGASAGPELVSFRDSASPAASDITGGITYRGRDSGGNATDYAWVSSVITDPTDGSEDARLRFGVLVAGVSTEHLRLENGQVLAGQNGTASLPAFSSVNDPNTGVYFGADDTLRFVTAGSERWRVNASGHLTTLGSTLQVLTGDTAITTTPGYAFNGDTDTGIGRAGADNIQIVLGGTKYVDLAAAQTQFSHLARFGGYYNAANHLEVGYKGAPLIGNAASNSAITFALADAGCTAYHDEVTARTWTIPANSSVAFPVGTVIIIDNTGNAGAAGTITLQITTDTLRRGDGTSGTGSRTISANQVAVIRKTKTTEWVITGTFT